jgi:DNA-binding LacI/PurR family transcriptional regulator
MPRRFLKVSSQVAQVLKEEIARRVWVDQLPGEQVLATKFQVSRKTIRAAFVELRLAGVIETSNGVGSRIAPGALRRLKSPQASRVGLLLPEPLERARQHTLLWVNHLMEILQNTGYQLTIFSGKKYFGSDSSRSLQTLCHSNPVGCWIIARSTRAMQSWFQEAKIPTLVAGSTHAGIALPSVDIDHYALCRHAAGTLLRHGHRRVALLFDRVGHAGDIESEAGFVDACTALAPGDAAPYISKIELSRVTIIKEVERLMAMADGPTAFLLSNSFSYLSVGSYLSSNGKRVPADVSLISRDEEPFLQYLHPVPARYYCPPLKFAAAIFRALESTTQRSEAVDIRTRIMPDFLPGNSIGRALPLKSGP